MDAVTLVRAYLDADIAIWYLRRLPEARLRLVALATSDAELWMSAAQRMEIVFHMRPGEERLTFTLLDSMKCDPVTKEIVDRAALLHREWHPSHGTGKGDAILAASAMLTGGTVITQNIKHFPMPGLRVERGWEQ